eukprot:TRINITY_DN2407_c0_g2_i2.p1 TRINITY_DN2407_c0_g2~~TRINITY_DN2407_c0_g2_i2.p1  ORF type:complete len:309 (-),score=12.70 TRINITY_DN2407_c0_g2_i2:92-1018(-)
MSSLVCPLCSLSQYSSLNPPSRLNCLHTFHKACIENHLSHSNNCPSCNTWASTSHIKPDYTLLVAIDSTSNERVARSVTTPSSNSTGHIWPHHAHPLYLTETSALYPFQEGRYVCDRCNCNRPRGYAYHCHLCKYSVCQDCYFSNSKTIPTPVTPPTTFVHVPVSVPVSYDTVARWSYLHSHALYSIDPKHCYPSTNGCWICDNCKRNGSPYERPYHCDQCNYDLCSSCINLQQPRYNAARWSYLHSHALYSIDPKHCYPSSNGCWICDKCRRNGSSYERPYHCDQCNYDLCSSCINLQEPRYVFFRR